MTITLLVVLAVYLLVVLLIGWYSRGQKGIGDYYVAGRAVHPVVVGFSWAATFVSAGAFVGWVALSYDSGVAAYTAPLAETFSILLMMFVIAPRIRAFALKAGAITVPEIIRYRFQSNATGGLAALLCLLFFPFAITAQYIAAGRLLAPILGVPTWVGAVGLGLIVVAYTSMGGFRAVARTDMFQAIVMLVGLVILVPVAVSRAGGISNIHAQWAASSPDHLVADPRVFIGLLMVWGFGILTQPHLVSRYIALRSANALGIVAVIVVTFIFITNYFTMFLGFSGTVTHSGVANPDSLTSQMAFEFMPAVAAAILVAAVVAAMMSSTDSLLLVISSSVTQDIARNLFKKAPTERQALRLGKWVSIAFGLAPIAMAPFNDLLPLITYIIIFQFAVLGTGIGVPLLWGLFWRRTTAAGAAAGLAAAAAGSIVSNLLGSELMVLWGFLIGSAACVGISLMTRGVSAERLAHMFPPRREGKELELTS